LLEVSIRRCARITKLLHWTGTKICELHHFDGLTDVATFFIEFKAIGVEQKWLLDLDVVLKANLAIWWVSHKIYIQDWPQCKRLMKIRFWRNE